MGKQPWRPTSSAPTPAKVPYCVLYDLRGDKIAALRAYIPMDLFAQQLQ
jgi:hypothetical protein